MAGKNLNHPNKWKPGQSGNPGGRARGVERLFQDELARLAGVDNTEDRFAGLKSLIERARYIAMEGEHKDANVAIKFLVERAAGLPKQVIAVTDEAPPDREIDWDQVPLEEKRELLKAIDRIDQLTKPYDGVEH